LAHAFELAQVKALIVEPELLPNALKAAKQVGISRSRVFVFDHHTPVTQPFHPSENWGEGLGAELKWRDLKSWRALMQLSGRDGMMRKGARRQLLRGCSAVGRQGCPRQ
jgi:4-coumarate--CoA ligase